MNPHLTQLASDFFSMMLIASIVGAGSYLFWRKVEGKYPFLITVVASLTGFFTTGILLIYIILGHLFIALAGCAIILIICAAGSRFHQISSDYPKAKDSSFLLLYISLLSSFFLGYFIEQQIFSRSINSAIENFYLWSLVLYPSATPFLIWIWKSSRLRPGIDKHFDE